MRVGKLTRDPIRDRAHAGRACGLRSGLAPAPTPGGDAAGVHPEARAASGSVSAGDMTFTVSSVGGAAYQRENPT
jgi:hypothetical protein